MVAYPWVSRATLRQGAVAVAEYMRTRSTARYAGGVAVPYGQHHRIELTNHTGQIIVELSGQVRLYAPETGDRIAALQLHAKRPIADSVTIDGTWEIAPAVRAALVSGRVGVEFHAERIAYANGYVESREDAAEAIAKHSFYQA